VPLHREKSGFSPAKKSSNLTRANLAKVPILTRPGSYVGKTQAFWTCFYPFGDRQLAHPGLEIPSRHPESTDDVVQQSSASGRWLPVKKRILITRGEAARHNQTIAEPRRSKISAVASGRGALPQSPFYLCAVDVHPKRNFEQPWDRFPRFQIAPRWVREPLLAGSLSHPRIPMRAAASRTLVV
jgi:hypothetical protein